LMSFNLLQTHLTEDEGTNKAVAVYKAVLKGKRKKFPEGFFKGATGLENASKITRYLIDDILKIPSDQIPQKVTKRTFEDNGLSGMLQHTFNGSPFLAIDNAYPGRFKKWEFRQQVMWQGEEGLELAREATKWLIEEKESIPIHEIPQIVTQRTFTDNGLSGMLQTVFNGSPYLAIDYAYPGRFKKWVFQNQTGMWQGESGLELAREATLCMIEEKEKIPFHDIPEKVTQRTFTDNGLSGMLSRAFNSSPYLAVDNAYPERFKKWEFEQKRMWQGESGLELAREATLWMIEEKEKRPFHEIPKKVTTKTFQENGLSGMLSHAFNDSPYLAIDNAYPGRFKKWEFRQQGVWQGEDGLKRAKEATLWMIEEKERIPIHEIPQIVTQRTFEDNGLSGMLHNVFKGSPYLAIVNAYPGRFKKWEFNQQGMWQGEEGLKLAKEATKWLIEEKERIPIHEIPQKITAKMFADNELSGMLSHAFKGSPYLAIVNAYPGRFKKWEFEQKGMWQGEEGLKLAREATKWLIEEKERIPIHEIPQKITAKTFQENGLSGMLQHAFNNFSYRAVDNAYPGMFTIEDFQSERAKALKYSSKIGIKTQKAFVEYITNYCKNHNLKFKYETKAGSGRVEIWCEGNKVTVIDITRATTKSTVIEKWRKRDYHEDLRIDSVWIVINSDTFSIGEYAEFNRNCPDKVRVFHILELFDELGEQPERELRLKLEAYSICRLNKRDFVRLIYQRALEEGKEHITEEDVQTLLTDFQN
jgi:hypothetical protein